jgi:hypothetical protein
MIASENEESHLSQAPHLFRDVFGKFEDVRMDTVKHRIGRKVSGRHLSSVLQMPPVTQILGASFIKQVWKCQSTLSSGNN